MRLWHKDLIRVLPRQQLLGQWRECCCIANSLANNDTPNHMLVNKILEYPDTHFIDYCVKVVMEMEERGYNVSDESFKNCIKNILEAHQNGVLRSELPSESEIFKDWHNDRYLRQCYYNLQEKYDCGGIQGDEWETIEKQMGKWWAEKKKCVYGQNRGQRS